MKIVFCTQNMAPFRMRWMDEIAKYEEVVIYQLGEYETGVNPKYISYVPKRAIVKTETLEIRKKKLYKNSKIIDEKADIYILDGYGFWGQQFLIIYLSIHRIPFFMSIDGGFINKKESKLKYYVKKFFLSKATAYFSTSKETDLYIDYYGGNEKVKYRHYFSNIMNSDIVKELPDKQERRNLKKELKMDDVYSIIAVGKFEKRKGFDLLIQAVDRIEKDIRVYFIGASSTNVYKSLLTEKNKNKIVFIDFVDKEALRKYYRAADLMLLPTREDVWGLVIAEAMAAGCCVVTTNRCLAGMAMLDANEIISVESVDDIVKSIEFNMALGEERRKQIGMKNIEKVKKYSIENATIKDVEYLEKYNKKKYKEKRK